MKVRYYGHVGQPTGYGRAAEATCLAMVAAGIELEVHPLAPPHQLDLTRPAVLPLARRMAPAHRVMAPDVVVVHTLPLDCERAAGIVMADPSGPQPYLCAYTTWEGASNLPLDLRAALEPFDHVFWPSRHNLERAVGLESQSVLPHAYDAFAKRSGGGGGFLGGGVYRFYYVGAWNLRKNPVGLLRAFVAEFDDRDHVELLLHCPGASQAEFHATLAMTGVDRARLPAISLRDTFMSDHDMQELHIYGDCFVTATRGEAWNLPAFDAMLYRRHVIAPLRMGHDDFLNETSAARIGGFSQPAMGDVAFADDQPEAGVMNLRFMGAHGLNGRALWREPDLKGLSSAMREAYAGKTRVLSVDYHPADRFGYEAVGKRLLATLEGLL